VVDNKSPEARVEVSPTLFSPNTDGKQDTVQISQSGTSTPPKEIVLKGEMDDTELQAEGFSPNGDGEMESIQISQETEKGYRWTGRILPEEEESPVLETRWEQDVPDVFSWNGQTDGSRKAESGRYFYELQGRDHRNGCLHSGCTTSSP